MIAGDLEAKRRGRENAAFELQSTAKRATPPAGIAKSQAAAKAVPKTAISFQPVMIRYRSYGPPASGSPTASRAGKIANERLPQNNLRELNAAKAGPASNAPAPPMTPLPTEATINLTASTDASLPQPETKSAIPDQSTSVTDRPAPPEQKESEVIGDALPKPPPADPAVEDRAAEKELPAGPTPSTEVQNAAAVTAQPIQQPETAPPDKKNEQPVSEGSKAVSEMPSGPLPAVGASPSAESVPLDDVIENSNDPVALNNAGVHLTLQSRYDDALLALGRAIAAAPAQWRFHRNLSVLYERMNRMDEALAEAQRSVELAPREPAGMMQLCALKVVTGHETEAIGCFDKLAEIGPLDVESQTFYGIALLRTGDSRKAVSVLEKAAGRTPANIGTLNALGMVYFNLKRYSDSAQCFKQAVELDPKHGELRFNLAVAQAANRNKEAGLSQYRILKGENPKLAEQLYQILFQDQVVRVDALKKR